MALSTTINRTARAELVSTPPTAVMKTYRVMCGYRYLIKHSCWGSWGIMIEKYRARFGRRRTRALVPSFFLCILVQIALSIFQSYGFKIMHFVLLVYCILEGVIKRKKTRRRIHYRCACIVLDFDMFCISSFSSSHVRCSFRHQVRRFLKAIELFARKRETTTLPNVIKNCFAGTPYVRALSAL